MLPRREFETARRVRGNAWDRVLSGLVACSLLCLSRFCWPKPGPEGYNVIQAERSGICFLGGGSALLMRELCGSFGGCMADGECPYGVMRNSAGDFKPTWIIKPRLLLASPPTPAIWEVRGKSRGGIISKKDNFVEIYGHAWSHSFFNPFSQHTVSSPCHIQGN